MNLDLFRAFSWLDGAEPTAFGGPLHIPAGQGRGRVDNPRLYQALYISDSPSGAIAEVYGKREVWTEGVFAPRPQPAGSVPALVHLRFARPRVLDLDDPAELGARGMRPSRVITLDREVTQTWARAIYEEKRWVGVRWWSYWESAWGSYGLWDRRGMTVVSVEPLTLDHPAVFEVARRLRIDVRR